MEKESKMKVDKEVKAEVGKQRKRVEEKEEDLLCQEMHEAWLLGCRCQRGLLLQQGMPFSHRGRAVTAKERNVVRE